MKGLDIHLVRERKELEQVFEIRKIVFIEGQNVPYDEEMDDLDDDATQIIACLEDKAVGCGRIRFVGQRTKLERLAVLPEYRGQGIGKEILNFMVAHSRGKGAAEAMMHAQCYANEFYRKCGFRPRGAKFMEAGIRHVEMYCDL